MGTEAAAVATVEVVADIGSLDTTARVPERRVNVALLFSSSLMVRKIN